MGVPLYIARFPRSGRPRKRQRAPDRAFVPQNGRQARRRTLSLHSPCALSVFVRPGATRRKPPRTQDLRACKTASKSAKLARKTAVAALRLFTLQALGIGVYAVGKPLRKALPVL